MKKQVNSIIIGVGVIAVLLILFFLISGMPSKDKKDQVSSQTSSDVSITNASTDGIKNINVKNEYGEYNIQIENNDDTVTYSVDKLNESQKLSKEKVDAAVKVFSNLNATVVEENFDDLKKFGLENPKCSVVITFSDDTEKKLYLGDNAPLNAGVYLKVDDEKNVYLISTQNSRMFFNSYNYFVDVASSDQESSNEIED